MNLGDIYLKSASVLLGGGLFLGLLATVTFLLFRRKQIRIGLLMLGTLLVGLPLSGLLLAVGQTPLFRVWHRSQNTVVPSEGCLTYEPTFFRLHATYRMDRKAFDDWASSHPWKLASCDPVNCLPSNVSSYFGLTECEAAYESPRGPKGNCLQAYYKNGIVYVFYSAM
jgi:hypothetical protein